MQLKTTFSSDPSLNTRLYVSQSRTGPLEDGAAGMSITLRKPTTAETFGRRLLNVLSFGAYTRHDSNPREWRAFKASVLLGVANRPGQYAVTLVVADGSLERARIRDDHGCGR
jgi:hypothetical protein